MAGDIREDGTLLERLDGESGVDYAQVERLNASIDFDTLENYEFGGKIAAQVGADLSDDRAEPKRPEMREAQTRMAAAARPQDWKGKLAGMSHAQQVEATLECLERKNNQKEILADLLDFCREERAEDDAVSFLEGHKQFADGYHSASKYLLFMMRTGAIEEREYDSAGVLITDAMRDELREMGATEDEVAEIAVEWRYLATAVGVEALERFDPAARTRRLLDTQRDSRRASYRRLLEYCAEPRSLADIVAFMDGDPGLEVDPRTGVAHMQPSAYIGLLDQAGALSWEGGWVTTPGGMEVLESMDIS